MLPLRAVLEDQDRFCNSLGYNHQPYAWLETLCEEMLEEKFGKCCWFVCSDDWNCSTTCN